MFLNFVAMCLGSFTTDFWVATCTKPARQFTTDVDFVTGVAHDEGLGIGVDGDEINPTQSGVDHAVDGVDSATTDTDHLDHCDWRILRVTWHVVSDPQVEHEAQPSLQEH